MAHFWIWSPCVKMNKRYIPVPCAVHSHYERAILQRRWLRLAWNGSKDMRRIEHLQPRDLRTRGGAEYLIARSPNGVTRAIRLDRIRRAEIVSRPAGHPGYVTT